MDPVTLTLAQIRSLRDLAELSGAVSVEPTNLPRTIAAVELSAVNDEPYPDSRSWLVGPQGQTFKMGGAE